jgi:hypothetical protein
MNNPHVILGIESHTCDCANEPVIRQRPRPEGINFEIRNLPRVLCQEGRRTYQQKYSELFHLSDISCDSTLPGSLIAEEVTGLSVDPRRDEKEIVYRRGSSVYSIPVEAAGSTLRFSPPVLLFSGLWYPPGTTASSHLLAVTRDGSRIYWPQAAEQPDSNVIHVRMGSLSPSR